MTECLSCSCFGHRKPKSNANGSNVVANNISNSQQINNENGNAPLNQSHRLVRLKRLKLQTNDENKTPSFTSKLFSWRRSRRKSTTGSTGPTYDYIDNDPVYSKVGELPNCHRYDYPAFNGGYAADPPRNEPFYTSSSQIYYVASDDPYSSIVSDMRRNTNYELESNSSGVYEVGYEKMAIPSTSASTALNAAEARRKLAARQSHSATHKGLEALYAKINRQPNSEGTSKQSGHFPVSISESPNREGDVGVVDSTNSASAIYHPALNLLQEEESGSGSVGSAYTGTGSSQNPSYRYLTVREPVNIIRERIRRQEMLTEQQREGDNLSQLPHREHYYSTIANEYESVGGDEQSLTDDEVAASSNADANASASTSASKSSKPQTRRHQVFRLFPSTASITLPISRLAGRFHQHHGRPVNVEPVVGGDVTPPRPPTSPVPQREDLCSPPVTRPVILSPTLPLPVDTRASHYQSNASLLAIRNYNDVIRRADQSNLAGFHPTLIAQRNSCSFDTRAAAQTRPPVELTITDARRDDSFLATIIARRNRISAPADHLAVTPPPLPPLPTPHGHPSAVHLLRKSAELGDQRRNENI